MNVLATDLTAFVRIDFDDTYDGLGDQLEEGNDDFNDDTFGGDRSSVAAASRPVGKDFDFFGQTAKVSNAINEEQVRFNRQQVPRKPVAATSPSPPKQTRKPARTGYEKYNDPTYIPDLQVNASLWGTGPAKTNNDFDNGQQRQDIYGAGTSQLPGSSGAPAKKMMSLEEVEASMRSQAKNITPSHAPQETVQAMPSMSQLQQRPQQITPPPIMRSSRPPQTQRHDQQPVRYVPKSSQIPKAELPGQNPQTPQILQRRQLPTQQVPDVRESPQPRQILQNPRRHQAQVGPQVVEPSHSHQTLAQVPSAGPANPPHSLPIITDPRQLMQLSEEERSAFLIEDAKRAKRNHKIYLLSKDNGLMTPQDKNFITRIQLQQLMTATGNVNEQDPDAALSEDFYYQVHSQIRGAPRQNAHQPLSHFAQTYLFQTGSRQGGFARRQNRGGDNHMQRMEQQVQRAVEAAKLKPKNKQLVIEGSLGKISFSNAKTPKPLLNIKRQEIGDVANRPKSANRQGSSKKVPETEISASNRKTILRNIENVYVTLMKMEDHERRLPVDDVELHTEWLHDMERLNQKLWSELKIMEPINPGSSISHPFIAFLSYTKGKKAIPRIFRHIDPEQRLTILTMIIVHLDILDVIRRAQMQLNETQLSITIREEVELFCQTVTPSLFSYVNDAPLNIIIGLLGLILDRVNMHAIARTKVGLGILTMLISRAELVKEAGGTNDSDLEQWSSFYDRLFDTLEPILGYLFPGSVNAGEDMYVWQFLAVIGVGASPEQQQRLVLAVKYVE